MRIVGVIWLREIIDKLETKHRVIPHEVEEVLDGKPRVFFVEKGERSDEDVYMALGKTRSGRYLTVLFIYKKSHEALILSSRDMATKERRRYERK